MENTILQTLAEFGISKMGLLQILFALMISILFVQSGLDKVFNWKAEQDFYSSHFSKTILKGMAPVLMPVITIFELAAGFLTAIGLLIQLFTGQTELVFLGLLFAALSIIQLFLGQRIAKDFAGAASLVPYFLLTAAGLYVYLI